MFYQRKQLRLGNYDYAQPGTYFVTICTYRKWHVVGQIVDGIMQLNSWGKIVQRCWTDIPHHFDHVQLDEYAIMPNHIHGIVHIKCRGTACRAPTLRFSQL